MIVEYRVKKTTPAWRVLFWRIADVLLSMTGFGGAHSQQDGLAVAVEVLAINSRFFKLSVRATEGYASLEPQIEEVRGRASAAARCR